MITTASSDPKLFGYWAYLAIEKHFQRTVQYETDVLKDKDPEALHQMRVGMRRLRTVVSGFAPALVLPKAAREKKIAKVARRLGQLRDLDIMQDALQNQYLPTLPNSEQKIGKKVLATLEKRRHQVLVQVQKTLKDKPYQEMKRAFQDWLQTPTYGIFAEFPIDQILPDLLLPFVSQFFLHPAWLMGVHFSDGQKQLAQDLSLEDVVELFSVQGSVLHSLRKQAKRVRYQMELFTDFYETPYQDYVKEIKSIQRILGQIQDSFVLAEFLSHCLNSDIKKKLPTLVEQLSGDRYQLWQEWRSLQERYLHPQTRKELRLIVIHPVESATYT
ncbi:CHAD domain superfamily [Coleofasciculus chthonoplastes PCC 7420]|uniref:CHAD domain superfamily n=1 Tax=Coleofasciculus chthonoplastes PCC 7420 TaxID=118168 RepID=B4VI42_9CYAN|nr:CHAD domain-containing protein [Coleofasciculus chthonoplastes]EDX78772.1 CHAD domain superfamily [Coleofasciculus chthonoplastes PCC 7420]